MHRVPTRICLSFISTRGVPYHVQITSITLKPLASNLFFPSPAGRPSLVYTQSAKTPHNAGNAAISGSSPLPGDWQEERWHSLLENLPTELCAKPLFLPASSLSSSLATLVLDVYDLSLRFPLSRVHTSIMTPINHRAQQLLRGKANDVRRRVVAARHVCLDAHTHSRACAAAVRACVVCLIVCCIFASLLLSVSILRWSQSFDYRWLRHSAATSRFFWIRSGFRNF